MSKKNPLTPAGIELATFRFVAQHHIRELLKHKYYKYFTLKHKKCTNPAKYCVFKYPLMLLEVILFISKTRETFENFEGIIKCNVLKMSKFGMVYEEVSFSLY